MSDTEQKTPNKTGASGAAWSDNEKVSRSRCSYTAISMAQHQAQYIQIAYLIVLCENEGKIDAKISVSHLSSLNSTRFPELTYPERARPRRPQHRLVQEAPLAS
jgi:hypothetical protein